MMNFLYSLYFALPNFARIGIAGKAINRIMLFVLKRVFDSFVPAYLKRTVGQAGYAISREERREIYIVSLTSFPARINEIWITIETIMRQSFKPDKIILWLAEEQFPEKKLPESLTNLMARGLSIDFCEDLRSHKKYFFSMQKYPEANIITVDDDVYYPRHFLRSLIDLHKMFPRAICANRAHKMVFTDGKIRPYRKWKHNYKKIIKPSSLLVQVGVGGVLYPPESLSKEVFSKEVFKKICFHADDLWLKVMSLKKETLIITNKRFNKSFMSVGRTQNEKLTSGNVINSQNDVQLKKVLEHYNISLKQELFP